MGRINFSQSDLVRAGTASAFDNAINGESGVYQLVPQCSTGSRLDVVGSSSATNACERFQRATGGPHLPVWLKAKQER